MCCDKRIMNTIHEIKNNYSSFNWAVHQRCEDMFIQSNWNGGTYDKTTEIDYDFGTDYGICCWFTPQLNYTEIVRQYKSVHSATSARNTRRMVQRDIDGHWFTNVQNHLSFYSYLSHETAYLSYPQR